MGDSGDSAAACPLLPDPGRYEPVDEYVDDQQCSGQGEHLDHCWSVEGHDHEGVGFVCQRYCPGIAPQTASERMWDDLRERLRDRLAMARIVLDEQGYEDVAALVPIEEVLVWMDEIGATDDR